MHTRNIHFGRNVHLGGPGDATRGSDGDQGQLIAGGVLTVVTAAVLLHPHPLALPLLSVVLVLAGFALAAFALTWRFFSNREGVAARPDRISGLSNLSGLIVFFGFAAAILGNPDAAVQSLQLHR